MERLAFNAGYPAPAAGVESIHPQTPACLESEASDSRLERLDSVAFKALLAFTFVLFVRPQDSLPFLQPFHLADVTATFALIALVGGRLARGAPVSRSSSELVLVLALGGAMLATAPFAVWPGGAVSVFTDLYSKVILVFALLFNTVTTRNRFERLVDIVVLGTSYIAVRAVLDYFRGINLHEDGRVGGAVGGLFGNPNDMALNMVAFLPLAIALALGRNRPPLLRLLAAVGIPSIAAAIIFTKSRGGTVGLVAMLLVLLYQMRRVRPGVALLVIAAAAATIPMLPESFTQRMSSIVNPEEDPLGSREARKRLLRESYEAFLEHPVTGLGAGQFMNYRPDEREQPWRETHNAVLQVAAELGVVGLVIFVAMIAIGFAAVVRAGSAIRRVRSRRRARAPDASRARREPLELYSAAMVASFTGWFAAALFASVAYYWTFYLVLGLAVTLRDITLGETRGTLEVRRRPYTFLAA
jgi:O-antigen ligase